MSKMAQVGKTVVAAGGVAGAVLGGASFLAAVGAGAVGLISGGLMLDVLMEGTDNKYSQAYKKRKDLALAGLKLALSKDAYDVVDLDQLEELHQKLQIVTELAKQAEPLLQKEAVAEWAEQPAAAPAK
jgi:ornithine cyclodeaminase/alanine dehydrogenase-like protein (mu-crystallin family)